MIDRRIPPCYDCGAWDDEREGCTMPALDRLYACPLEYEGKEDEREESMPECISQLVEIWQKIADQIQEVVVHYRTLGISDEEIIKILTKPDEGDD